MSVEAIRVSTDWLDLREAADARARSLDLVDHLRPRLPAAGRLVVHDLACGTGAMGRWLAPLLPGRQRWVLHDRDADLLEIAADGPGRTADGARVAVEARRCDVTRLHSEDLAGADLVTASALLDLLTADELAGFVGVCAGPGCPVLLTLSVTGRVELAPADPLDTRVGAAFNAHQRRVTMSGRLLGPEAVSAAVAGFRLLGAEVIVRTSPWRLAAAEAGLAAEWFAGWVRAACEQDASLATDADRYARRRSAEARAGRLTVSVGHADLLVLP